MTSAIHDCLGTSTLETPNPQRAHCSLCDETRKKLTEIRVKRRKPAFLLFRQSEPVGDMIVYKIQEALKLSVIARDRWAAGQGLRPLGPLTASGSLERSSLCWGARTAKRH